MIKLFFADLKMMIRGRQSLFWALVFPLMFTVIFGFFFGGSNSNFGTVAIIDNAKSSVSQSYIKALKDSDVMKVNQDIDESTARSDLKKGQVSAIVIIPSGFGEMKFGAPKSLTIVEDPSSSQVNSVINGFTSQFFTSIDYKANNIKPIYSYDVEKTNQKALSYFDFVLMGIIGFALMNASIQGIAITMANYREDKILKRITTTPLASWKFVAAEVLSRLVLNFIQIAIILSVGYYGFHAHIYGNILILYVFAMLGGLLFQCIGFMVASVSKTTDSAQGLSILISIPMMFLSGVFFPIDQLPKWLNSIVSYLPLAPLLRMIRQIGLDSISPFTDPKNILIVAGWIFITLIISLWRFRLSEE